MNRRQLLQLATASGAVALIPALSSGQDNAPAAVPAPARKAGQASGGVLEPLRFIVFGDWGSGAALQHEVAAAMSLYCQKSSQAGAPVAFAISTGDNFYDNGVADNLDEQWQTKFELMYPAATMNFPFFAVLGNHDWRANPATQFSYRGPSGRWRMDGFYYRVAQQGGLVDFFMVDTDLWLPHNKAELLAAKQTQWLDKSLAASKAKWKFVVGHHPPFTDGAHAPEADIPLVRGILTPLCARYNVTALLSGHDHDLQHIVRPDLSTHFVISGASGAGMRPRLTHDYGPFYQDLIGGFLAVEVTPAAVTARFLDSRGNTLHEWTQV